VRAVYTCDMLLSASDQRGGSYERLQSIKSPGAPRCRTPYCCDIVCLWSSHRAVVTTPSVVRCPGCGCRPTRSPAWADLESRWSEPPASERDHSITRHTGACTRSIAWVTDLLLGMGTGPARPSGYRIMTGPCWIPFESTTSSARKKGLQERKGYFLCKVCYHLSDIKLFTTVSLVYRAPARFFFG
jgi:hypothetical protein